MNKYNSKDWLHKAYVVDELSTGDIAKIANVNSKTVYKWLIKYGIPTRPRGHNYASTLKIGSGSDNAFYGRKHTSESIARMSESSKGESPWLCGSVNHWYGKSGENSPNWKGGVTPERQSLYASDEWTEAVKAVWQRDNATCQKCGKYKPDHRDLLFAIHHIVAFAASKELRTEPSNLVLLCRPCHLWIHSRANVDHLFIKELSHESN